MPNFRIHRINDTEEKTSFQIQSEMVQELKDLGCTWFCMTYLKDNNIFILDGWKIQPEFEEPIPKLEDVIGFGI